MQFLADLVDKGYNNRNADGATEQGNFVSGKSAIYIDGGWNVPTHVDMARKNELPFKYGAFKVPQLGPTMAAMLHSHTFIIPHSDVSPISDEKRAAVLRIMGWFSKNSLYWSTAGHYLPHRPTVESPFFQNMWPNKGYADVGEVGFFEPNHPIFGIAGPTYDVMGNWFQGGVNGDISVEEAIQGAREEIEAMM
jgi:multiple sugar transport system substrate-binding protein